MKTALIVLLCFGVLGGAILLRSEHLAWKLPAARIMYNSQLSKTGALYQSHNGQLLLFMQEQESPEIGIVYILSPMTKEAFLPNRSNHTVLPGLIFTWQMDQGGVQLGSAKIERDPQIIVGDNRFAFSTALSKDRVEISW